MRNIKKALVTLVALVACLGILAGCSSSPKTLSDWYAKNSAKIELALALDSESTDGVGVDLAVDNDTLVITYTMEEAMDLSDPEVNSIVNAYLDEQLELMRADVVEMIEEIEQDVEGDVKVKMVYNNPDGSLIFEKLFEK